MDEQAIVDRILTSTDPDGRWSLRVETEDDAADLSRFFGVDRAVNIHVGDCVEGRVMVTDR